MTSRGIGWSLVEIAVKFAGGMLTIFALLAVGVSFFGVNWELRPFPAEIGIDRVIDSENPFSIRDGCAVAFLSLDKPTVERLGNDGLNFLAPLKKGRRGADLSPWRVFRPVWPDTMTMTADGIKITAQLSNSCDSHKYIAQESYDALKGVIVEGGAYYATAHNGADLLILAPRLKMAAYFSWH